MRTAAALETRLRRLEAQSPAPLVVRLLSFSGGELVRIVGPRRTWDRLPDESADALRRRAVAEALAATDGAAVCVLREVNVTGAEPTNWKALKA